MREFGVGRSLPRMEDARFVQGIGRYTDDIQVANAAHMWLLRSPHASARIRSIDVEDARQLPGVLTVLTGADADADGLGTFSTMPPQAGSGRQTELRATISHAGARSGSLRGRSSRDSDRDQSHGCERRGGTHRCRL